MTVKGLFIVDQIRVPNTFKTSLYTLTSFFFLKAEFNVADILLISKKSNLHFLPRGLSHGTLKD